MTAREIASRVTTIIYSINCAVLSLVILMGSVAIYKKLFGTFEAGYCSHAGGAEGLFFMYLFTSPIYIAHIILSIFHKSRYRYVTVVKLACIILYPVCFILNLKCW